MQEARKTETARQEIGSWLKGRIDDATEINLPEVVDEAVQEFSLRWSDVDIKAVFPEVLRAFVYDIGVQTIADRRPDAQSLEVFWSHDNDIPLTPPASVLNRWMEHVNGRYMAYTEMGSEELMEAADAREKRLQSEMETVKYLRETAEKLEEGQTMRAQVKRQLSPAEEARERQYAKNELEHELSSQHFGECTDFCWYCGTILKDQEPPNGERWQAHEGPKCSNCGTTWARAYTSACPVCDTGFLHLNQPNSVSVDFGMTHVQRAAGLGCCDCCGEPALYDIEILDDTHEGSYAFNGFGNYYLTLKSMSHDDVHGLASDLVESDS